MATSDAPIQVGHVVLTVNDLNKIGDFYQNVIGLARLSGDASEMILGVDDKALVVLRRDGAAAHRPHEAGLFHTAFLLPDRATLGSWIASVAKAGIQLDGASDHLVSEALYLRDPEGNGIEVYCDRPRSLWQWRDGEVVMESLPLDIAALLAAGAKTQWRGAPQGSVIGHVHLQVGDVGTAERFYTGELGLDRTAHMHGASFFSSGGYHHSLAANIWRSRGAGPRSPNATGLAELILEADAAPLAALPQRELVDPWGTRISVVEKA